MYTFAVTDECENTAKDTVYITREIDKYDHCETAYAKLPDLAEGEENPDAKCFLADGFDRWGWTNKISPSEEPYLLPLYAGAAQCDVTKGIEVGMVEITYFEGLLKVEYIMHEGFVMTEAHVYAGCDPYPVITRGKTTVPTVAPGQYTWNVSKLEHSNGITVNFPNVTGDIYVIVHAVTCAEICRCSDRPDVDDGKVFEKVLGIECVDPNSATVIGFNQSELTVFPNPFTTSVTFEFVPGVNARAKLDIFNSVGQLVTTLIDQPVEKGVLNRIEYKPVMTPGLLYYRFTLDAEIFNGTLIYNKLK